MGGGKAGAVEMGDVAEQVGREGRGGRGGEDGGLGGVGRVGAVESYACKTIEELFCVAIQSRIHAYIK